MTKRNASRYFKTGPEFRADPEIIRLAVRLYARFPLSLRNVEDLLHERGIEFSHEAVRFWWNRFGPMFAADIRRNRAGRVAEWRQLGETKGAASISLQRLVRDGLTAPSRDMCNRAGEKGWTSTITSARIPHLAPDRQPWSIGSEMKQPNPINRCKE